MEQVVLFLADDLHLEGRDQDSYKNFTELFKEKFSECKKNGNVPILICAGDIGENTQGIEWASQFDVETIYVCGNHEFWNNDYYEVIDNLKAKTKEKGFEKIHFLHNEEIVLNGIRFLGGTMWTDLGKSWAWIKKNYILKHFLSMGDFRKITAHKFYENSAKVDEMFKLLIANGIEADQATNIISSESFNPLLQIEENAATIDFFENKMIEPFDGKTIIVTHHLPNPDFWMKTWGMNENILTAPYINNKAVYKEYLQQKISPEKDILMMGFYVNTAYQFFDHSFSPDLWIHGHFHKEVDDYIGTTRIASNPVGYAKQSSTLNIKEIYVGDEIVNYLDHAINKVNQYDWNTSILKNLDEMKKSINDFVFFIKEGDPPPKSLDFILSAFKKQHDVNLKELEVFVSNMLYNFIKIVDKDKEVTDQIYITSFVSGFGKWASKQGKVGIDPFVFNINKNSFAPKISYQKTKTKEINWHYLEWLEEVKKIESQVIKFKEFLVDFFHHLQEESVLEDDED